LGFELYVLSEDFIDKKKERLKIFAILTLFYIFVQRALYTP